MVVRTDKKERKGKEQRNERKEEKGKKKRRMIDNIEDKKDKVHKGKTKRNLHIYTKEWNKKESDFAFWYNSVLKALVFKIKGYCSF